MALREKIMKKLCLSKKKKDEIAMDIWKCIEDEFESSLKNQINPCESISIQLQKKRNKLLVSVTIKEHCIEGIEFTDQNKIIEMNSNMKSIHCIMCKVIKMASKTDLETEYNRKAKIWIFHKNFFKEF